MIEDLAIERQPGEPDPNHRNEWYQWYFSYYGRGNLKSWDVDDVKFVESQRLGTLQKGYKTP